MSTVITKAGLSRGSDQIVQGSDQMNGGGEGTRTLGLYIAKVRFSAF